MQFWKKFWKKRKEKPADDMTESFEERESYLVDLSQVNLSDEYERSRYITSLLEQIGDAQEQIAQCEAEYKTVEQYLLDMEELGYIPAADKQKLTEFARSVQRLQVDKQRYEEKKHRMSDEDFAKLQRLEEELDEGIKRIREAEGYQELVRGDLKKLEAEKQSCIFRKQDAATAMENLRGMTVISCVALLCCFLLLLCLQFALQMDVRLAYILTASVAALVLLVVYMKYTDARNENVRASRSLNKVILLQNRVKIRYVNNTNLLDYLYLKFETASGKDLEKLMGLYQEEKEERSRMEETMQELVSGQEQLVQLLRRYKLHDPLIWLHQVDALLDPKEMVEVRHALISRRQKIRKRIEFNTENAESAQQQIKDLVADYPQYAKETLKLMSDFEGRIYIKN